MTGDKTLVLQRLDTRALRELDTAEWNRLAANALVENAFYTAPQVKAAIDTVDADLGLEAVAIRDADGHLVGLFPYSKKNRSRYPLPAAFASANDFQASAAPLVDRDRAVEVVDLWLDDLKRGLGRLPWVLRNFPIDSAIGQLIVAGAAARGFTFKSILPYQRATLTRIEGGFEAHLSTVLSKNRLKDVRRTMRRLAEMGQLEHEHAVDPELVNARIQEFLALEHSGWKGEQGTSVLSHDVNAAFFRQAHHATEENRGHTVVDSLLLDGKVIAMKVTIREGRIGFTPKIAYDENYKKLGPGMALEYKLLEAFYASDELDAVDAAATIDGHSALSFFNERQNIAMLILGASWWQTKLLLLAYEGRQRLAEWRARRHATPVAAEPAAPEPADGPVPEAVLAK